MTIHYKNTAYSIRTLYSNTSTVIIILCTQSLNMFNLSYISSCHTAASGNLVIFTLYWEINTHRVSTLICSIHSVILGELWLKYGTHSYHDNFAMRKWICIGWWHHARLLYRQLYFVHGTSFQKQSSVASHVTLWTYQLYNFDVKPHVPQSNRPWYWTLTPHSTRWFTW